MSYTDRDRTLALCGIVQACELVNQVARRGIADSVAIETSIGSLFAFDPESVEAVYGGSGRLLTGLRHLRDFLRGKTARDNRVTRYVVAVLRVERSLRARDDLLAAIHERLVEISTRRDEGPVSDPNVLGEIADLYTATISTLTPRILVNGEPQHLREANNVNRIRSLLLAAVRSAVLWRQCGGSRLQILFGRRRVLEEAERLISSALH